MSNYPEAVARDDGWHLVVDVCPLCGGEHLHGRGEDGDAYGGRESHCGKGGYVLVREKPVPDTDT